jgi:hypothetical protein
MTRRGDGGEMGITLIHSTLGYRCLLDDPDLADKLGTGSPISACFSTAAIGSVENRFRFVCERFFKRKSRLKS